MKPSVLPPIELPPIEPELQAAVPRPFVWEAGPRPLTDHAEMLLERGVATRAWVLAADTGWDSGHEAGPNYEIDYAWEHEGQTHRGRWRAAYDGMHLAMGAPEYSSWLDRAMCDGGSFTVLLDPGRPANATIYGNLELYVRKTLLEAVAELEGCDDDVLEERVTAVYRFAIAPFGRCQRDWKEYYGLLSALGMFDDGAGRVREYAENLEVVRRDLRAGRYDRQVLARLSALCATYRPGVWAAT